MVAQYGVKTKIIFIILFPIASKNKTKAMRNIENQKGKSIFPDVIFCVSCSSLICRPVFGKLAANVPPLGDSCCVLEALASANIYSFFGEKTFLFYAAKQLRLAAVSRRRSVFLDI